MKNLKLKDNLARASLLKRKDMFEVFKLSAQINHRKAYLTKSDPEVYEVWLAMVPFEDEEKSKDTFNFNFFKEGPKASYEELKDIMHTLLLGDSKFYDLSFKFDNLLEDVAPALIPVMFETDLKSGDIKLWKKEDKQKVMYNGLKQLAAT